VTDLTPLEGVQAQVQEVSHRHPGEILVGLNDRDPQLHDVYRVNLDTGERARVLENPGFVGVLSDDDLRPRLGVAFAPDFTVQVLRIGEGGAAEPFLTIPPEDTLTTTPVGFDKAGAHVFFLDSRGRDKTALAKLPLDDPAAAPEILAEGERADISGVLIHPTEKHVQAVATNYTRNEWVVLDPSVREDFDTLRGVAAGDFAVVSRTLNDRTWIVAFTEDAGPTRFYRYDRNARAAALLFTARPALENLSLAPLRPVVIPSRDGKELVSYLTLPVGADTGNEGRPREPLPLVLWIHGGPWARDTWGFNGVHQWLADRGYAALSINYRGSTGFGKEFLNAANREWGGKMHDDLLDAVDWAVREGIADPACVAIGGGSYGGYATLVGITFTPDTFACGVDIVGPSNLITFMKNIPPYWMPMLPLLKERVGDVDTEEGRAFLAERSPLSKVEQIRKPLLIAQGANDPRVVQSESDQIVAAMKEKNIPVTYVLYPDEGHGFVRPENGCRSSRSRKRSWPSTWAAGASRSATRSAGRASRSRGRRPGAGSRRRRARGAAAE
jgi:dipeptidyl aminopeptidase/acylaminoacyl peptidase